ncbi:CatB-related O-acetyltransferase [Rhodococcus tibetensis]|uniref:CatB-related O-acetyltransferase n=1 Tax=Rhodococcus tibetensis TaxID=2965064 RepID=A0ABT1QF99_9NOCA|nr:CatB-related O-acetyltransferase [Rhodococcus sp. FXJ9.536]MCQ4120964.1 CatB-related O-acetyltransferase [Rhodococcus sp. FXJ9.536]
MKSPTLREVLSRHHGLEVGHHSYGSLLDPASCDRGTTIGNYVSIGPGVRRFGANHPFEKLGLHPYLYNPTLGMVDASSDVDRTSLVIGHDVWIGANTVILAPVTCIGNGAVIGAGSIVTKEVPDFAVVAGNPARIVKYRFDEDTQNFVAKAKPWNMRPDEYVSWVYSNSHHE